MEKEQRQEWVRRGFVDPVVAYRKHAASAVPRGIEFKMTFSEWWSLWEPHYEKRGRNVGQMVMCRTNDQGAYEIGNVRIDTVQGNADDRSRVYREKNLAAGRLPLASERVWLMRASAADWIRKRQYVFQEYVEEDDSIWEYDPA